MRSIRRTCIVPLLFLAAASGALGQPASKPIAPFRLTDKPPDPPYPMNYTDEAARTLGITHGRMDVFSFTPDQTNGLVPNLRGTIDRGKAMFELQWRPGS